MPSTLKAAAAAALVIVVAGCGGSGGAATPTPAASENSPPGDIPDNQAFVAYAPPQAGYAVKVPEGWSRTTANGATSFTDKLNTVRLETGNATSAPTVADAKRTAPAKARVSLVKRTSGPAVRIAYLARSQPDPVTGKARTNAVERYLFFHSGHEAIVTLSGPKGADNVDPWRIITDSLRWTG